MLTSRTGRCQPLKYLKKNRETAPYMLARIRDVDRNGPTPNRELFRWLAGSKYRGFRLCEYKVHHPRACRAYAFRTDRGFVIARVADKTEDDRELNATLDAVRAAIDRFIEGGRQYE